MSDVAAFCTQLTCAVQMSANAEVISSCLFAVYTLRRSSHKDRYDRVNCVVFAVKYDLQSSTHTHTHTPCTFCSNICVFIIVDIFHFLSLLNQSINHQSKHISIAPFVASESEAHDDGN